MRWIHTCLLLLISLSGICQEKADISISTSSKVMEVGDVFSIKINIRGSQNSNVKAFPQIEGFQKEGRSVSHANVKIDDKTILQHIVTQNYRAVKWGTFDLPEYEFLVNGKVLMLDAEELTVSNSENPLDTELVDTLITNEDALLFLFVDKSNIVVGEGFRVNLAFYVSDDNTASWEFPKNLTQQINQISNQLKPDNCLESRREIIDIKPEPAVVKGKNYIKYKFFESVYYPLSQKSIELSSARLNMDKVSIGADSSRVVEVRSFFSRGYTVNVSALPEHPLKDRVAVGKFKLKELSKVGAVKTGKILSYSINIKGEGNVKTMLFDKPENDKNFDFYPPQTEYSQTEGYISGEKTFTFKVFPKDSGYFDMGNYFYWVYYNTQKQEYDTLKAKQSLIVTGERIETSAVNSKGVYDNLEQRSISERSINYRSIVKVSINVLLFLMLVGMLFIFDFRRQRRE
ncbi:hypothetical protein [uncultured Arcticibacterium sp.]|uniref:hypothetical protein n=1 Tax=uncultured Arcticibacterium sp. TaxID=2173042 RepID=UPI0030F62181